MAEWTTRNKIEKLLAKDEAYCAALRVLAIATKNIEDRRTEIEKQLVELRVTKVG